MVELTLKQNVIELLNKHIDRCRKAVSECPKWSPAQAEWSRARDALLNFGDDLASIDTPPSSSTEICPDCNGAGGDNQYWRCARCNGSGGIPSSSTPEVVEAVARAICKARGGDPDECISGYSWAARELGRTEGGSVCHMRNWERFIPEARAAIAALPPSNMIGEAIEALEPISAILEESPELNQSNYTHDEVCELNDKMIEAVLLCRATLSKLRGEG